MLPKKPSYDDYFEQKTSTFHGQSLGVTISILAPLLVPLQALGIYVDICYFPKLHPLSAFRKCIQLTKSFIRPTQMIHIMFRWRTPNSGKHAPSGQSSGILPMAFKMVIFFNEMGRETVSILYRMLSRRGQRRVARVNVLMTQVDEEVNC